MDDEVAVAAGSQQETSRRAHMTPVGRGGAAGGERHGKTNRRYSTELAYARIVPAMRWGVAWPPAAAGRWGPGRRPSHTGAGPGRRGGDETRHYCDPGDKSTRARGRDDDQASWQRRNSRARSIEIHPQQQMQSMSRPEHVRTYVHVRVRASCVHHPHIIHTHTILSLYRSFKVQRAQATTGRRSDLYRV
jgi:hypothetical protein